MSDSQRKTQQSDDHLPPLGKKFLWADNPDKVSRLITYLAVLCGLLFVFDFIIHRHAYFSLEGWYGFYGIAGFVAFTLIVVGAKNLRKLIGRGEDYYAPFAVDAEEYPAEGLDKKQHNDSEQAP